MNRIDEQFPQVFLPPDHPELYPFWARGIARLMRLGIRPLFMMFIITRMTYGLLRPLPKSAIEEVERSPGFYVWIGSLAALGLLALYSLGASIVLSLEILEFSIRIPWAMLVSTYAWLVVAGSGLCIISAFGGVFGVHRYEMMSKRIVFLSLTTILFGLSYILLHLGRPERMPIYNAISPNFRSAIAWMGTLYNVYLVIVVLEFWLLIRSDLAGRAEAAEGLTKIVYSLLALRKIDGSDFGRKLSNSFIGRLIYHPGLQNLLNDPRLLRLMATLAFVTGVAALTMLGSVFAHIESRSLWYGPYYPVYFLVSALFCGYAFLLTVTIISYRVRGETMIPMVKMLMFEMAKVLAFLLAVGFMLMAFRLFTSLWEPARQGPTMLLLNGPFRVNFWVFEVALMSVIPAFILLWAAGRESLGGVFWGALMALAGAFFMRYDFVVAGQVYPNIREGLPSYLPTFMEILIILGVFGGFLLVYTLGERFLPLKEEGGHHAC